MLITNSRSFIGTRPNYLAKAQEGFVAVAINWDASHDLYRFFTSEDEAIDQLLSKGADFVATISCAGRLRRVAL